MLWRRIRLVLLGLLLCVGHVMTGTCERSYTDPTSSALLADVVIEGKVRQASEPNAQGTYNITVAPRKYFFKGAHLINKGKSAKKIIVDKFHDGAKDEKNCIGNVQPQKVYFFFLRTTGDPKGLYFQIMAMPVKKSKKIASDLRKVLCDGCAKSPSISSLTGPGWVNPGADITLTCSVESNPIPVLSWYKDNVLFKTKKGKHLVKSRKRQSTLQIKNLTAKDSGVYSCAVRNVLGEDIQNVTLTVVNSRHSEPCETQTLCLNGGTCMYIKQLRETYCQCPKPFEGMRCERMDASTVLDNTGQASLMMEQTLIIVGIVVAVLVFIVICIASFLLAKRGRKQYEQRRKRRQSQLGNRSTAICIDNTSQSTAKKESEIRNESIQSNSEQKKPHQIMLHDSSAPPVHQIPHGNPSVFPPHQHQHAAAKATPNIQWSEPRGRLAASSVYDNFKNTEPVKILDSRDVYKDKGIRPPAASENIEMASIPETKQGYSKGNHIKKDSVYESFINGVERIAALNLPPPPPPPTPQSSQLPTSLSLSLGDEPKSLPSKPFITSPELFTPSLISPSSDRPEQFHNNMFSLSDNDNAIQPLLPNHSKQSSMYRNALPQYPFESRSDKDLSRYLPLDTKHQGSLGAKRYTNNIQNNDHLRRDLSKLSHSNTFPKSKVNGLSPDTFSDSDEDNASEVPYQKQLDLYISEDDLNLSNENLVSGSFSSVNTPSRQASRDEPRIGPLLNSGLSRPGIRKHQSEEGSTYNQLLNKGNTILQDSPRSRSFDNPPGTQGARRDTNQFHSTLSGSPEVETYDNVTQQPLQLNLKYIYDPNDDSAPWDKEINRSDQSFAEERDRQTRLKDVLPDQPAIPI